MKLDPRGIDRQVSRGIGAVVAIAAIWLTFIMGAIGTALYIAGAWVGVW